MAVSVANTPRRLAATILGNYLACCALYGLIEHHGPIASGWWGIVTASTVGYGDMYPESTAGRGVAAWLMVSMLVLTCIATAQLAAWLVQDPHVFTDSEQEQMKEQLNRLERLVRERI